MSEDIQRSGRYDREDESSGERLDRQWNELLQELPLAQTGTQILFAFLLSIAFTNRFQDADKFAHGVYAGTLVASALAAARFLAPVSFHRVLFRRGMRDRMVPVVDKMIGAGLVFLLLAIAGGVLLAIDVVLSRLAAFLIVAFLLGWFVVFWYVVPALIRAPAKQKSERRPDAQ
jgi:hypothetical protein